jgi:hypothetical protein
MDRFGPRQRPPPRAQSQGTYGAKVAVPHLLALLERHRVRATFFVPGRVAERHPERPPDTAAAGHRRRMHCHRPWSARGRQDRRRGDHQAGNQARHHYAAPAGQPALITGFLSQTGLALEPEPS